MSPRTQVPVVELLTYRSGHGFQITELVTGPGLSRSCSFFALDGESRCHGGLITWEGKSPPPAVDIRADTEFAGFHRGQPVAHEGSRSWGR